MDKDLIQQEFLSWLTEFVEKPNAALGNFPTCPYARAARINGKMGIEFRTDLTLMGDIERCILLTDSKEVIILLIDINEISAEDLSMLVQDVNKIYMPLDYVILEDHPMAEEFVNGSKMNFGKCSFLAIQRLSILNDAANKLRETGYYKNWSQDELDQVVTWRYVRTD